jgi:hcp family T6SS protein ctsH3
VGNNFGQLDLVALAAATGDEFAMFSVGGRRLIIRGNHTSVPVTPEMGRELARQEWRWSSHTHSGSERNVLRSSDGDRAVLGAMEQVMERPVSILLKSRIFNSRGDSILFTPNGNSLQRWKP